MRWSYWHGNKLAIYRSRVRVLAGHHCYLHLCASVIKQYNLVVAKGVISLAGKVAVDLLGL